MWGEGRSDNRLWPLRRQVRYGARDNLDDLALRLGMLARVPSKSASTFLHVAGLANPAYLVEIEGEAVREA